MPNNLIKNLAAQHSETVKQFIGFNLVGFSGLIINLSIYSALIYFGSIHYLIAASLSFIIALTSNYYLNMRFTFKSTMCTPGILSYLKFFTICLIGYSINMGVLYVEVEKLGLNVYLSQFIAILAASLNNFIGSKQWVFIKK